MVDHRFHRPGPPLTAAELARIAGAELGGAGQGASVVRDVAALDAAGPEDASFLDNPRYLDAFGASRAGVCVVHPDHSGRAPPGMTLLLSAAPYRAFAQVARALYPPDAARGPERHPTAVVGEGAQLADDVALGPGAVIGPCAELARGCRVGPHAVIGPGVVLGEDCAIGAHASLQCCVLGARVVVYPGVRIGQDGFGFASGPQGHLKVPQLGRVLVGDDVEIGANACIDRGSMGDTVIGPGCIIDNLVQIGHNVRLGRGCVIVSQVGISGSTHLGDFVVLGGQVGLAGHLEIGSGARLAAKSGVAKNIPAGQDWGGYPAVPIQEWRRQVVSVARLGRRKGN